MAQRLHIFVCSVSSDQQHFYRTLRDWIKRHGHILLGGPDTSLDERLDAARACDLCILLLEPQAPASMPGSTFSTTELEAAAAAEQHPGKVLTFALAGVEHPATPEQFEFIRAQRSFVGGSFQATCQTPRQLLQQVRVALARWTPPVPLLTLGPLAVPTGAIMISSTGDLVVERSELQTALRKRGLPVIDYLSASSEVSAPIERVTSWARSCRALFLILGTRYGYVSPADGLGVTELEFATALHAGHPIYVFVRPDAETTPDQDQRQFLERVRTIVPPEHIFSFASTNSLRSHAMRALDALRSGSATVPPPTTLSEDLTSRWYRRHLIRWLGTLPSMTQPTGMSLERMSISLYPVQPTDQGQPIVTSSDAPARTREQAALTAERAAALYPRLVVRGLPGSGKSALLHWYALTASASGQSTPIVLSLAMYAHARNQGTVSSLFAMITAEERRLILCGTSDPSRWGAAMEAGQGLVLLDDFDAIPSEQQAVVVSDIQSLAAQAPASRIIVASRSVEYTGQLSATFGLVEVLPLNDVQQQSVVEAWLRAAHPEAVGDAPEQTAALHTIMRPVLRQLRFEEASLNQWVRTLRILTLFTAIADVPGADISTRLMTKAEIYHRVLHLLLTQPSEQRRSSGNLWAKEQLLLALAWPFFLEDGAATTEHFSEADIAAAYTRGGCARHTTASAMELVRELSERDGILLRSGTDTYTFLHATFCQYLCAVQLTLWHTERRTELLVRRRLSGRWEELTQLVVSELDRQGRSDESDAIIWALFLSDTLPIASARSADPSHLALVRASRCQGERVAEHARADPGPQIARAWGRIWRTEPEAQRTAMQALFAIGPAAVAALDVVIEAVEQATSSALWANNTLAYLGRAGVSEAQAAVERFAAHKPQTVEQEVLYRMDASITELAQLLHTSPDVSIRRFAAMRLKTYGVAAAPAVLALGYALDDKDDFVRSSAASALNNIGPTAAPVVDALARVALRDANFMVCGFAYSALKMIGTLPAWSSDEATRGLRDSDQHVCERAIGLFSYAWTGPLPTAVLSALVDLMLNATSSNIRREAAGALAHTGGIPRGAQEELQRRLHAADATVQHTTLDILTWIKSSGAFAIDDLRQLLTDRDVPAKRDVLYALQSMGPRAAVAIDDLRRFARDPQQHYKGDTLRTLVALGDSLPETIAYMGELLRDPHEVADRSSILEAVKLLGVRGLAALDEVVACLSDANPLVSSEAVDTLRAFGVMVPGAIDPIVDRMRSDDDVMRATAFFAIRTLLPLLEDAGYDRVALATAVPSPAPHSASTLPLAPVAAMTLRGWLASVRASRR